MGLYINRLWLKLAILDKPLHRPFAGHQIWIVLGLQRRQFQPGLAVNGKDGVAPGELKPCLAGMGDDAARNTKQTKSQRLHAQVKPREWECNQLVKVMKLKN